jgi:hypothetical protein
VLRHGANSGPGQTPAAPPSPLGERRGTARGMPAGPSRPANRRQRAGPPPRGRRSKDRSVTEPRGPRRGHKPMGGASAARPATVGQRQRIRQRSKASRPTLPDRDPTRTDLATGPPTRSSPPDGAPTARRQRLQRCGTAADEGNPSKGHDRVARRRASSRWCRFVGPSRTRDRRNATNPRAGSGVQQTRGPAAEKAVEVVRIHADGTRCRDLETPTRWCAASATHREWTQQETSGGGATSGQGHERRTGRDFGSGATVQRSRERSEDDAKVTRVDPMHFGASGRRVREDPEGPGR